MIPIEQKELYDKALDTLETEGWKDVILIEFGQDFNQAQKDIMLESNTRDRDMFLKGKLEVYKQLIGLKEKYTELIK